jgi:hypothetical protein
LPLGRRTPKLAHFAQEPANLPVLLRNFVFLHVRMADLLMYVEDLHVRAEFSQVYVKGLHMYVVDLQMYVERSQV